MIAAWYRPCIIYENNKWPSPTWTSMKFNGITIRLEDFLYFRCTAGRDQIVQNLVIANAGISITPSAAPLFSLKRGGDVMTFQTTHFYFNLSFCRLKRILGNLFCKVFNFNIEMMLTLCWCNPAMNNLANLKFRPVNQTLYFYANFDQLPRISPRKDFGSLVGRALDCTAGGRGFDVKWKKKKQECKHTFHYGTIHGEWFLV